MRTTLLPQNALKMLVYAVNDLPKSPIIVCGGVWGGGDILAMAEARPDARFIAIDSFEGLSQASAYDGNQECGKFAYSQHQFELNVRDLDILVIKEWITEESVKNFYRMQVDMLWLDLDLYEPTKAMLSHYGSCSSKIYCHDYDNKNYPGVKKACDEFGRFESIGNTIGRFAG